MASAALRKFGIGVGLLLVLTGPAPGNSPTPKELVQRLGDPSFAERERAFESLRGLRAEAIAALEEGLKSPDAEVRRRCAELLPLARRSDLDVQIDSFVTGAAKAPAPFPGWENFRKVAGDDRAARQLFTLLGQNERSLLEALDKDPGRVGENLSERVQQVLPRGRVRPADNQTGSESKFAALLLMAACAKDKNSQSAPQLFNCLYQPGMRTLLRDNEAARRLLTPFLARQLDEPWRLQSSVWLARNLNLDEFTENTLKPAVRRQAEKAAANPADTGNLFQAATSASMLGMRDTIEGTLKPAARILAEKTLDKPDDPGQVFQTLNLLQTLNMQDTIDATLRPAACLTIESIASKPYDQYRFHMALNLANALQLKPMVEHVLKPAAVKALISLSQHMTDRPAQMYEALNLVQTFDLKDASEDFLKPAARRFALAAARSGSLPRLTQAAQLVNSLGLKDNAEQVLRDAVNKLAGESADDLNRVGQLVTMAQSLGMQETIDRTLKPRARKALAGAAERTVHQDVQQSLQLARTLQLKEGVPLAIKAAKTKELNTWTRSAALMFVAEFGDKEHVALLEPLLTDGTSIGSMGFNSTTINTQLRDVALAVMVSLSGQSLEDYDYPYLKLFGGGARPFIAVSAHCYGFSDDAGRQAALKKWRERAAAKK